jgi:NACHT domain
MKPDTPATSSKRKEYGAIVSLILAAIGLPTTLIAFFQQFVTEHVVLTTILIVFYELLVFIFGFVNNIWEILAKKWIPDIASWIDGWVRQTISSYLKRSSRHQKEYYRDLKKRCNELDTRGVIKLNRLSPIPFHEGFVHLYLEMIENSHNSSLAVQTEYTIWHYLADKDKAFERLIITGPAISGKTTLLKHTILVLATRKPPPHYRFQFRQSRYTPFLLSLREQIEAIELGSQSLVDVLNEQLKKRKCQLPEDWFPLQLNKGCCLILLDGLDTLRNQELRDKAIGWIEKQMLDFDGNRFIVTSNEFAIRNNTSHHFTTVKLRPFQPEQARLLVESWLMYDKKNGRPGKKKFHQPDHWKGTHFPSGEQSGNAPILGIRRSDASAFCYWLTEHEHDQWRYRLPTAEEIANARKIDVHGKPILNAENNSTKPTTPTLLDGLPVGTGYWTKTDFSWAKESQVLETSFLRNYYTEDLDQPKKFLDRVIDDTISIHRTQCLDLDDILSSIQTFAVSSEDLPGTSQKGVASSMKRTENVSNEQHHDATAPMAPSSITGTIDISKYRKNFQDLDATLNWRIATNQGDKLIDDIKAKRSVILQYLREIHETHDMSENDQQKNDTVSFPWFHRLFHRDRAIKQESPALIKAYAEGYFALAMLDARLEGSIPPCEGILIVKERKSDNLLV